jgi:hypothetical protein
VGRDNRVGRARLVGRDDEWRQRAAERKAQMGAQRTSFAKLQRDRAKKAKAAMKRERRQNGAQPEQVDDAPTVVDDGGELSAPVLLALIEQIQKQFENEEITFEEYEEKKLDLLSRLPID